MLTEVPWSGQVYITEDRWPEDSVNHLLREWSGATDLYHT